MSRREVFLEKIWTSPLHNLPHVLLSVILNVSLKLSS